MKRTTVDLPTMKPRTAQYVLKKSVEENKTTLQVLVEIADKKTEEIFSKVKSSTEESSTKKGI